MKSKFLCLMSIAILSTIALILPNNSNKVQAQTISTEITIDSDTTIDGSQIVLTQESSCYNVTNNSTLTITNSTISNVNTDIDNIFYIESGCKLILNNVDFDIADGTTCNYGIKNSGIVEITDCNMYENFSTAIYHNNTSDESLIIKSGNNRIGQVFLGKGYINITKDTKIVDAISIRTANSITYESKCLVNSIGDNVFASKFLDKFTLAENMDTTIYYIDYIGDTDSQLTITHQTNSEKVTSGDLVLASKSISYETDSKKTTAFTSEYCTANNYLQNQLNSFGQLYTHSELGTMNNYYMYSGLSSTPIYNPTTNEISSLSVKTTYSNTSITSEEIKFFSGSNIAIFVDIPNEDLTLRNIKYYRDNGEQLIETDYLSIDENNLYSNGKYLRPIVEYVGQSYESNKFVIEFIFAPPTLTITPSNNIEIEYSGTTITEYSEFNEEHNILVTYSIEPAQNIGNYKILSVSTTTEYSVELASGDYYIEIIRKTIKPIFTPKVKIEIDYAENINVNDYYFFEESMPSYLSYTNSFVNQGTDIGDNAVIITISLNNSNYLLDGETTTEYQSILHINLGRINTQDIQFSQINYTHIFNNTNHAEYIVENIDLVTLTYTVRYNDGSQETTIATNANTYQAINAGTYLITANITITNANYVPTKTSTTTTIVINKLTIDTSEYESKLINEQPALIYNGTIQSINTMEAFIPSQLKLISAVCETESINRGNYNYTITLGLKDGLNAINYIYKSTIEAVLVINPLNITISIDNSSRDYNGLAQTFEAKAEGVLENDTLTITLKDNVQIDAGNYIAQIVNLSNNNYSYTNAQLAYSINKIDYQVPNYTNKFEYSKQIKTITFDSPLVEGFEYSISRNDCINAGEYDVTITFSGNHKNYKLPNPIETKLIINPKPIGIKFSNYENLVENGVQKAIDVQIDGEIEDGDICGYTCNYSSPPKQAGQYNCYIVLENPNYIIVGNNSINFVIFAGNIESDTDVVDVEIRGGKFDPNATITINNTTTENRVSEAIKKADISVKKFYSHKINFLNKQESNTQIVLSNSDIDLTSENIRVYKLIGNKLESITFEREGDKILFDISNNDEIVIVELQSSSNIWLIITLAITISLIGIGSGIAIMFVLKKRPKKANK